MNDKRKNHRMRSIVNFGIHMGKSSIENAAEYLKEHNVPLHISIRVLANNHTRMEWSK